MAEPARSVRFVNILLGIALVFAPFILDGGSRAADLAGVAAGIGLVLLSPRAGASTTRTGDAVGIWCKADAPANPRVLKFHGHIPLPKHVQSSRSGR